MFFISKIAWAVANPVSLVLLLAAAGLLVAAFRSRKAGLLLVASATGFYLLLAFSPLGDLLLSSLESREPPASLEDISGASGIIVLGGTAMEILPTGTVAIHNFGGRMTGALELARRFPKLPLIFSGGDGALFVRGEKTEAEIAFVFFKDSGIEPSRIRLEDRSRNTYENAVFTAKLLKPGPEDKWVLVTSAFHMPRARALFEAQGFKILPWPTDYQPQVSNTVFPRIIAQERLCRVTLASKEWLGQAVYWLRGDIAHL